METVATIARVAPLAPEPYLITGAIAQLDGRDRRAERLFEAARARAPRSDAARYFLAERYLRTGRTAEALLEMAAFARLTPGGGERFAPVLAAFAKEPGAVAHLQRLFRDAAEFRDPVLAQLARDASNHELVMALAGPRRSEGDPPPWQGELLGQLVARGEFARAADVWRRLSGIEPPRSTVFDPQFEEPTAPPPFAWSFPQQGAVAEPGSGGLRIIYFGRDDSVLAQQMLLLSQGRYNLGMRVSGDIADGTEVAWTLTCLPGQESILTLPLQRGQVEASFAVPSDCSAQQLRLIANAGELSRQADFRIAGLRLRREGGR